MAVSDVSVYFGNGRKEKFYCILSARWKKNERPFRSCQTLHGQKLKIILHGSYSGEDSAAVQIERTDFKSFEMRDYVCLTEGSHSSLAFMMTVQR